MWTYMLLQVTGFLKTFAAILTPINIKAYFE